MLLCLDVGNTQILGGVYDGERLLTTFRRASSIRASSDEFGLFFRAVLRENGIEPQAIHMAGICSVVPDVLHSLKNCFRKYFRFEPLLLQPGVKTGLKIRYRNPLEVGADKIGKRAGGHHAISRLEPYYCGFRNGYNALRGDKGPGIPGRNHYAGHPQLDGHAGIEDRAVAGGGNCAAIGSAGAIYVGEHSIRALPWHAGNGPDARRDDCRRKFLRRGR
jgi:hypothetical protein